MEYDLGAGDSSFPGSWPQIINYKAVSRRCCVGGCKSLPLHIGIVCKAAEQLCLQLGF